MLRLGRDAGLAVSLDGTGRIGRLDPRAGGALAVLEAARNVACAGGEPLAVTDCLNFGNPEKPEMAWELAEAIEGIAQACEALGIPVVSGNVSLYNETGGRPIHPTPVVGCVGLVPDVRRVPGAWREGDAIYLAGAPALTLDGSEYQARYGELAGRPAPLDLAAEARLIAFLHRAAPVASLVHDAAEGGLAVCLAEALPSAASAPTGSRGRRGGAVRRRRRAGDRGLRRRADRRRSAAPHRHGRRRCGVLGRARPRDERFLRPPCRRSAAAGRPVADDC